DITDLKRAEQALRESEERFRGTFENAAVGIAHNDPAGRFLCVNEKFIAIVGYSREELLERSYKDFTHPDDLESNLELFVALMRGELPSFTLEKRYLRKDGSLIWVELFAALQRDAAGKPAYAIGIVLDISERKRLEAELSQAHARLELAARLEHHDSRTEHAGRSSRERPLGSRGFLRPGSWLRPFRVGNRVCGRDGPRASRGPQAGRPSHASPPDRPNQGSQGRHGAGRGPGGAGRGQRDPGLHPPGRCARGSSPIGSAARRCSSSAPRSSRSPAFSPLYPGSSSNSSPRGFCAGWGSERRRSSALFTSPRAHQRNRADGWARSFSSGSSPASSSRCSSTRSSRAWVTKPGTPAWAGAGCSGWRPSPRSPLSDCCSPCPRARAGWPSAVGWWTRPAAVPSCLSARRCR